MSEGKPLLLKTRKQTAPSVLAIDFPRDREVVRVLPSENWRCSDAQFACGSLELVRLRTPHVYPDLRSR